MDAASDVVTIPASDDTATTTPTTAATIQKPTDTLNVNQSNNNNNNSTHTQTITHTGSNSLLSKTTSNVIGNSLNIGASSNSNSSCSSSSTSSNSSGYGSSTTTPTNNYDLQNTTPTTTPVPTTPVANTEHIIPVATVAAVTPFYSDAITTHSLETQHHHHYAQQSQQQQQHQQQQQQHHVLPTHPQQYSQNHLPANIQHQQHHQYLSRQQYYSPYEYQQPAPTHNLSAASATPSVAPYNIIIPGPYEMSSSNIGPVYGTSQYKTANPTIGSSYERSSLVKSNAAATSYTQPSQHQNIEQQQSKTINQHFTSILSSSKPRSSSRFINNSTSTNTSKPQAAATPFYANPSPFYDNYKHKIPLEYHDTYSSSSASTAATYHQQQKYYAAAKSQLKEASYGSPAGLNSKSAYANTGNVFPGSTAGLNLSSASYDKYMYPHAAPTGFTTTGHMGNETPPDVSNYRKPVIGSNMNSPSWPWGIEYASGNSRSIPPPASHIPTATVAPTHTTHLTQNPPVLARDPFYMTPDKYVGKYDKYSTSSYPQTYVSPPTNRHMWPNTPHASNMTPLNERHMMASGPQALPAHGLHTSPYYPNNPNASLNSRQTCCSQSYQPQSCYYPVSHPVPQRLPPSQNPTVAPTPAGYLAAQQSLGQSPHLNALTANCKYSGILPDYGNVNKIKNSNDLYLNSYHYDNNPSPHNFGYATAHNNQQLYNSNAHQAVPHGVTATSLLTNDSLNANPTSYTNDLNVTPSNFDNYHTHLDNLSSQQTLTGIHNTQPTPVYGPTGAKRALLDYRKPIQPQPPPTLPEDCYPSLTSREHFNQHELLNTPETTTTFEEYEVHQLNANDLSTEVLNDAEGATGESNKNLSLRDFIANWNDDEDEYQNNEEINFDESAVINEVFQTAPVDQEPAAEIVTIQEVKVIKPAITNAKDDKTVEESVKTAEGQSTVLTATEANQYVNLPDIVIDIKKSNNVNGSIATPTTSPTTPPTQVEHTKNSYILTDFDVEKELDELNLKKPLQQESSKEINDIKETKSVKTPQLSPCKNLSFEDFNLEPTNNTVLSTMTARLAANQGSETNEQYLKDIEGYESSCSRHSNESAFEKEYETFINKITNDSSGSATKKDEQKTVESEKDMEFDKNVQDFSKFYKRKRKIKEDEQKASATVNQSKKKIKTNEATQVNSSNFPQVYTKKCRNRLHTISKENRTKRKPLSAFYKIIYPLRHQGVQRLKRVREFMMELKEKHLPLIKRQSIKNYTPDIKESTFNPKTLQAMCVMVFNTEEFRQNFLMTEDLQQSTSLETETEEKHICDDPTCETCEVIKSLMDTGNFEATLLQQTMESSTVICEEITKESIRLLEDETNTKDLNLLNEKAIIISNEIVDNQHIRENLSDLPTESVLLENFVFEETNGNFLLTETENMLTKAVLKTDFDNFTDINLETNCLEIEKARSETPGDEFLQQDLSDAKLGITLEKSDESEDKSALFEIPFVEDLKQPAEETSFNENLESKIAQEKNTLDCDLSKLEQLDTIATETSNIKEHLNDNLPAGTNPSSSLNTEQICKTKEREASDCKDSESSDLESESSFSDTEDSKRCSCSESSDTDTENDSDEDKVGSPNLKKSKREENKPTDTEAVQEERGNISETKTEQDNCSVQRQTNSPQSPPRIIIRITKCLSPNEQSLRVENISAKTLKTQKEYDNPAKCDAEEDEENTIEKTEVFTTKQEDLVAGQCLEKQTESLSAENCKKEKKLVTPLKLVLRGKEYLRVKSNKKSLKLQTERDSSTESESENDETLKRKSKIFKVGRALEHEEEKYIKRSKLKDNEVKEDYSNKVVTSVNLEGDKLEAPVEKINKQEESEPNLKNLETSISEMSHEITEICKSLNNMEQTGKAETESVRQTEVYVTSQRSCGRSDSDIEEEITDFDKPSFCCETSEEQIEETYFGGNSQNRANFGPKRKAANSPLQSPDISSQHLNEDIISAEINEQNHNLSPKQFHSNENSSQNYFMPDMEIEKASFFAVLPEYRDNAGTRNLVKTSSLEIIETYSLTDSEDEDKQRSEMYINSFSDSESLNDSEFENYDDSESLEQMANFNNSKPIVISDDDSLDVPIGVENFEAKIKPLNKTCKDDKMVTESKESEYEQKSRFDEDKKCVKKLKINTKRNPSCLKSPTKLKQTKASQFIEATKKEKLASDVYFDMLKEDDVPESQHYNDKLVDNSSPIKQNYLSVSDQEFSDCNYISDEQSDEDEVVFRTSNHKSPDEEIHLLVPSLGSSPRIDDNEEFISETTEDSSENIFPKINAVDQSSRSFNLIEERGNNLAVLNQAANQKKAEESSSFVDEMVDITASPSCENQNETEEIKVANILERKQSQDENLEYVLREHSLKSNILVIQEDTKISTPKTFSAVNEEQYPTLQENLQKISQDSPEEFPNVICSEDTGKVSLKDLELSQEKYLECKNYCSILNQSLEINLDDVVREKKLIAENPVNEKDIESCSSGSCSPVLEEYSNSRQVVFDELSTQSELLHGKINLSTKTKAAYKSFDIQNDLQEESLSQSEAEKPGSTSQKVTIEATEIETDSKTQAYKSKSPAPLSAENENIYLFEGSKKDESKSEQSEKLDEVKESNKFEDLVDIGSPPSICSPANENQNETEEVKSLESHTDEIIIEEESIVSKEREATEPTSSSSENDEITSEKANIVSEDTKAESSVSEISTPLCRKDIDNIDPFPEISFQENIAQTEIEVSNNNVDVQDISETIHKPTLVLAKDSIRKDVIEENGKNSITEKSINDDDSHDSNGDIDYFNNSDISLEVKEQSLNILNENKTEIENKITQINCECEKSKDIEDLISPKAESFSPESKSFFEVIEKDSTEQMTTKLEYNTYNLTEKPEAINKTDFEESSRCFENVEETMKIPKPAIEELVISDDMEVLENKNKENVHSSANTGINKLEEKVLKLENHNLEHQNVTHVKEFSETSKSSKESEKESAEEILILRSELNLMSEVNTISEENKKITGEEVTIEGETKSETETKETNSESNLMSSSEKTDEAVIKENEESDLKESPVPSNELEQTSEVEKISEETNNDDNTEEVMTESEIILNAWEQTIDGEEKGLQESSVAELLSEVRHKTKEINSEESTEGSTEAEKSSEENDFKGSSIPIDALCLTTGLKYPAKEIHMDESNQEKIEEGEHEFVTTEECKEILISTEGSGLIGELQHFSKKVCKESSNEKLEAGGKDLSITKTANEAEKKTLDEKPLLCNKLNILNELQQLSKGKDVTHERKIDEVEVISAVIVMEKEAKHNDLEENSNQSTISDLLSEVHVISKEINKTQIDEEFEKETEEKTLAETLILSHDSNLAAEEQQVLKYVADEYSDKKISSDLKSEIETQFQYLDENSILSNEFDDLSSESNSISKPIDKDIRNEETNEEGNVVTKVSPNENEQNEPISQETEIENLAVITHKVEFSDVSGDNSNKEVKEKLKRSDAKLSLELENICKTNNLKGDQESARQGQDIKILEKIENAESSTEDLEKVDQTLDKVSTPEHQPAEDSAQVIQLEKSNETSIIKSVNKSSITPDELSADFFGFKNQSSFEDDSEDFHGFEDLEEVKRIRQEIENINDDNDANDGFFNNFSLNREMLKTSTTSLNDSVSSEINELEALEKELSQHQIKIQLTDEDKETEKEYSIKTANAVSPNDIEHIKQMLESDEEPQNDVRNQVETMTQTSKDKSVENKTNYLSNVGLSSGIVIIPKLSDLCRAALNSSLNSSSSLAQQHTETATILVERELSVEEALAEMYRQAGVLLSDPEDCDNDVPSSSDDTEASEVLLFNLQEMLNSDNNDVYVLQCDMNENVLNVVPANEEHAEEHFENDGTNTERVNSVQIILDTECAESHIHIISSDSESEVIILSDDESDIPYRTFREREERVTIPFINDDEINSGEDSLFDISTIHHEEIVPDNLAKFLQEEFYKYLHEKYVQRNISKYYHANRVLKKYKRRFIRRQ